jgi:tetratricopeptide (TPR) repeat protein
METEKEKYNKHFENLGPQVHDDPIRFETISKLCQGSVLDIACGNGTLADFYKGEYCGVDISDVAIKQAEEMRRKSAKFFITDVLNPNFSLGKTFDTIVIGQFLEHIKNDKILIQNIAKHVRKNTRLIISVPNADRVKDKNHVREFTVPKLRKMFLPAGKVKFRNYEGFEKRILLTVDIGKKNDNLLSLAMPAKNEEKGIEKAILSCIEIVDNIVISVDKASTDKTLEIAKNYADVLLQHKWEDNFAKVRNFIQENIKTKWSLILDAHEYVEKAEGLDQILKENFDGFFNKVVLENGFSYWNPRLVKTSAKWHRPVHNYVELHKWKQYKDLVIQHDRIGLQNKSTREARNKQRNEMVYTLMHKKLKKDKKDTRSAFYLAQQYTFDRKFKKAIKHYKHYLKYSTATQERWLVYYELGNAYNNLGKHRKAIKFFKKANKELPNRWEIAKRIGTTYMIIKKWKKALKYLVDSFVENKSSFVYNPEPRNNAQTWFFISQCFFALKLHEEAKIALKRAKNAQTDTKFGKLPKDQLKIIKALL